MLLGRDEPEQHRPVDGPGEGEVNGDAETSPSPVVGRRRLPWHAMSEGVAMPEHSLAAAPAPPPAPSLQCLRFQAGNHAADRSGRSWSESRDNV